MLCCNISFGIFICHFAFYPLHFDFRAYKPNFYSISSVVVLGFSAANRAFGLAKPPFSLYYTLYAVCYTLIFGAVAERLKATVLKTVIPKGIGGSNPSCSVSSKMAKNRQIFFSKISIFS